jgi:hypothetical protein
LRKERKKKTKKKKKKKKIAAQKDGTTTVNQSTSQQEPKLQSALITDELSCVTAVTERLNLSGSARAISLQKKKMLMRSLFCVCFLTFCLKAKVLHEENWSGRETGQASACVSCNTHHRASQPPCCCRGRGEGQGWAESKTRTISSGFFFFFFFLFVFFCLFSFSSSI